jgi:hypothetical protein
MATAAITGTATATINEVDIRAGGKTIIITLTGDTWVASGGVFNGQRQAIIDGLNSAQSELTGWNNEVRDNLGVADVNRDSDTQVTVDISGQSTYDITAQETIEVTVPASALVTGPAITAAPTFTVDTVAFTAAITGTAIATINEADVIAGLKTILITLTGGVWVASGGVFNGQRQAIINGITSAQSELLGWNNEVRDNLATGDVTRTSDTLVTVILSAQATYDISAQETIEITVPTSALVPSSGAAIVATPTFTVDTVPLVVVTGSVTPRAFESEIVAGGQTIIITLTGALWVTVGANFDAQRQNIIDGLDSNMSEVAGWNAEVRDKEVVGAVVRTSDTVVTITLTASASFQIALDETITVTMPASAFQTGGTAIATNTFEVEADPPSPDEVDPAASIGGSGLGGISRNHTPPGVIVNR